MAAPISYNVIYLRENSDDDHFTEITTDQETKTAESGTFLSALLPLAEDLYNKYDGFHLLGTGMEITGCQPGDDVNKPAGIYSETGDPAFAYGYFDEHHEIVVNCLGYVVDGSVVTGNYTEGVLQPMEAPLLREDGSSLIMVFYARDRYALQLRARDENDPMHPVTETGDENYPQLPEAPFIVKNGVNLSKRFTEDSSVGEMFRYFSASEPEKQNSLQWTWWARWKGINAEGDPLIQIASESFYGDSFSNAFDTKNVPAYEYMDGETYGLADGDSITMELWRHEDHSLIVRPVYEDKNGSGNNQEDKSPSPDGSTVAVFKKIWEGGDPTNDDYDKFMENIIIQYKCQDSDELKYFDVVFGNGMDKEGWRRYRSDSENPVIAKIKCEKNNETNETVCDGSIENLPDKIDGKSVKKWSWTIGENPIDGWDSSIKSTTETLAGKEKKVWVITNNVKPVTLTVKKLVSGSLASRDKYFKFTINIDTEKAGTVLTLSGADANPYYIGVTNPYYSVDVMKNANTRDNDSDTDGQQIICGSDGKAEIMVYLRHGQTVEISGIPQGSSYTVTEVAEEGSFYTVSPSNPTTGESLTQNTTVTFTNEADVSTPTGIDDGLKPAFWMLVFGLLAAGGRLFRTRSGTENCHPGRMVRGTGKKRQN